MVEFDRRVVPTRGLDSLIVNPETSQKLRRIVLMEKARQILYSGMLFIILHIIIFVLFRMGV